jgi:hypothetical protein
MKRSASSCRTTTSRTVGTTDYAQSVERPPTDFELLRAIYERHHRDYVAGSAPKIQVPIDIKAVADDLGVQANSVFGRLYHRLDQLYGERPKFFFSPVVDSDRDCVNFPLLEAVLAGLWQQHSRELWTNWLAHVSIGIALASLTLSVLVATGVIG